MSIFGKITLLFTASLLLMLAIGYRVERLDGEKREALMTQQYLQDAGRLFTLLATTDTEGIGDELAAMGLVRVGGEKAADARPVVEQPHSFGSLKILKNADGDYLLSVRYMDTALLLENPDLQARLRGTWLSKGLIGLDIFLLVILFSVLLAMLAPLRRIAERMRAFSGGDYDSRVTIGSRDEIGEVAATYNEMAQHLQALIAAREALLRDIGHELRTPIARGMFALEKLPPSDDKRLLQHCFTELERLTGALLQIEKLRATGELKRERFDAETLILQALSKTMAEEEKIAVEIGEDFTIEGDLDYLSLAVKNLIDNAVKYATELPVTVTASGHALCVGNRGEPLTRALVHYLQPFSRETRDRNREGFGLGLAIVRKVLERHGLALDYAYADGNHRFCIRFRSPGTKN